MTRYDPNHQSEELGRTPENSADVPLNDCNAFNLATQCQKLSVLECAKWPTENDFMEWSELCKDVIELFEEKAK